MDVRTTAELGLLIRERRKQLRLGQAELATRIGASRQWIIAVEAGKRRADVGLVLRALTALGISLDARLEQLEPPPSPGALDIDAIVRAAKRSNS